jgi:hypothetical protein
MMELIEETVSSLKEEANMDFSERPVAEDLNQGVRTQYLDYMGATYFTKSMRYY